MATPDELSDFLAQSERRAFKQAAYAVRDDHAALDIVQDAMMRLAEKYGQKPASELPMLFQRILQNAILDFFRRRKVRNLWVSPLSVFSNDDDDSDPLEMLAGEDDGANEPTQQIDRKQTMKLIEKALTKLPSRQREAFVLRYWQELDVAETASIMGCSEGSVKTHCSRAVHALAITLRAKGVSL
ncbi:MAG: RNA polymerase sigma factor [Methylophilales bacterium]|nr:RNA polymerase sigma factor [Methylophilales bacterium]